MLSSSCWGLHLPVHEKLHLQFLKLWKIQYSLNMFNLLVPCRSNESLAHCLNSFHELMDHGEVSWDILTHGFIKNVIITFYFLNPGFCFFGASHFALIVPLLSRWFLASGVGDSRNTPLESLSLHYRNWDKFRLHGPLARCKLLPHQVLYAMFSKTNYLGKQKSYLRFL